MSKSDGDIQAKDSNAGSGGLGVPCRGRAVARGAWGGLGLVILCLSVYLPGLWSLPAIDRDESRFAQASRQMFQSKDFVVPKVQDRPRLNKPPLIYWAQCGALWVLGDDGRAHGGIWVYRLPSVLAAVATVLLTWRLGLRMFDPRAALLGAALLAVCPMVVWDAHQARADQLLLTTVVLTQLALWRVWRDPGGWTWPIVFWIGIGLGIMTKGPITPLIALLTSMVVSVLGGGWAWTLRLRPMVGAVIVAAMVGPWVYAVGGRVGWSAYVSIVSDEVLGRSAVAKEGHWGPPGYHLVATFVLFWPGVLLTVGGLVRAWRRGVGRLRRGADASPFARRRSELFCLGWIIPAWTVFELVGTKLPHYTMPLYPALALLSARAVLAATARGGWERFGMGTLLAKLGIAAWLGVGVVLAAAPLVVVLVSRDASYLAWKHDALIVALWSLPACGAICVAARAIDQRNVLKAQLASLVTAAWSIGVMVQIAMPATPLPWVSERVMAAIAQIDPQGTRPIASVKFHEDSLVFATRGQLAKINAEGVREWITANPTGLVILPEEMLQDSEDLLAIAADSGEGWPAIVGYNYSVGKRVRLVLTEGRGVGGAEVSTEGQRDE